MIEGLERFVEAPVVSETGDQGLDRLLNRDGLPLSPYRLERFAAGATFPEGVIL